MPRRRPDRAALAAAAAVLLATATACGDTGGLRSAGPTPTAITPARLWPGLTPASSPAYDIDEVERETVKSVTVPGDDIRAVDPAAIVRAEIAANPDDYTGAKAPYRETAARMADCASGGDRARCPVLEPYYWDLTGDGHEDLALGFRQLPGPLTAVRVYTVEGHRLVQVMAWEDAVSAVELAGRSLVISSPSDLARYEYRLEWTWDPEQRAMLLTHDEMVRTGGGPGGPRTPGLPRRSPPSVSPSARPAPSPSGPAGDR
ncbi:hypothetical protein ACL02U_10945 [Streptomyces sp. MS06]|uniref:hypothetical protein n=1 Tax=Streptomyces sp. MS06 TaxID=3385974 RepID=UPI0039A32E50